MTSTAAMYADDTTVIFSADDTASLEFYINNELVSLDNWLNCKQDVTQFLRNWI